MKTFLRIVKTSTFVLIVLAALGALITLAAALWAPIPGFTLDFFDNQYNAQDLAETSFLEWMTLFFGTTIAYIVAAFVGIFALAFGGSVVVLTLLFVALGLVLGALALLSPILVVVGLVWLCVWAVRRYAANRHAAAVAQ